MHYLLTLPLPKLTKPLPEICYIVSRFTTGLDENALAIPALWKGAIPIPYEVERAADDYWDVQRRESYARSRPFVAPTFHEQIAVLLGLWLLYRQEPECIGWEPV